MIVFTGDGDFGHTGCQGFNYLSDVDRNHDDFDLEETTGILPDVLQGLLSAPRPTTFRPTYLKEELTSLLCEPDKWDGTDRRGFIIGTDNSGFDCLTHILLYSRSFLHPGRDKTFTTRAKPYYSDMADYHGCRVPEEGLASVYHAVGDGEELVDGWTRYKAGRDWMGGAEAMGGDDFREMR